MRHLAGTNSEAKHIATSRKDTRPDFGHIWHPDSFGTQYTNGTLTIVVNGLSLEKNWCDPKRIPPWAFENVGGLIQAAEEVRARPTRFNTMDCFPPGTNISEVDAQSLILAAQMVQASNGNVNENRGPREEFLGYGENRRVTSDGENTQTEVDPHKKKRGDVVPPTSPSKKRKTLKYPNCGRPLQLSNLKKKNSRVKGGGRKGRSTVSIHVDPRKMEGQLCEVVVSPSKEWEEAERCGLLGQ